MTVSVAVRFTPLVAEIVTALVVTTVLVTIVKFPVVAPAGMVTLAGTMATKGALLDRVTTVPPAGAGPDRVTVPVEELKPFTVVGFKVKDESTGALTVRMALWLVT